MKYIIGMFFVLGALLVLVNGCAPLGKLIVPRGANEVSSRSGTIMSK